MAKKAEEPAQEGGGNEWLTTYCDMVTLLFTFFVLLFAISQVDVQKFNLLVSAFSNKGADPEYIMEYAQKQGRIGDDDYDINDPKIPVPGEDTDGPGSGPGSLESSMQAAYDSINAYLAQSGHNDKVDIAIGDDFMFIRFTGEILFGPNSSVIRNQDYTLLQTIGNGLKLIEDGVATIRIDGHTAAIPEQEDYPVSDRVLSSDRSNAVLMYFEDVIGIDPSKLAAFAHGKYRPVADNNTEQGRAQNRRIEILVTKSNVIDVQLDAIYEEFNSSVNSEQNS